MSIVFIYLNEHSDREALDIQRAKERGLRATKRELVALDEAIKATKDEALKKELSDDFGRISVKLAKQENSLNDFLDQTGFKKDYSRSQIKEFDRSMSGKIKAASKKVDNLDKNDIMKSNTKNEEVKTLRHIGKIDRNIYKCVTEDIRTEEVIITNERIQHIKDRHPKDYERYCEYMQQIIENPDYIIEANKENTALILKAFSDGEEQFKTVLRLVTSTDNSDFKNSIITFMKINEKEWRRLIKNKKILYKSE